MPYHDTSLYIKNAVTMSCSALSINCHCFDKLFKKNHTCRWKQNTTYYIFTVFKSTIFL